MIALGGSAHTGEVLVLAFTVLLAVVVALIVWVARSDR